MEGFVLIRRGLVFARLTCLKESTAKPQCLGAMSQLPRDYTLQQVATMEGFVPTRLASANARVMSSLAAIVSDLVLDAILV